MKPPSISTPDILKTRTGPNYRDRRPDERAVPNVLTPYLDRYIACYRSAFNSMAPALWIGRLGKPLSYLAVEKIIAETTRKAFGNPISPHLFRARAATTAYLHASDTPHLASGLLQHTNQKVTEQHYNRAGSAAYGKASSDLIEKSLCIVEKNL